MITLQYDTWIVAVWPDFAESGGFPPHPMNEKAATAPWMAG
jgi:hypothetical protein